MFDLVVVGFWTLRVDSSVFDLLLRALIMLAALAYVSLFVAVLLRVYGCPLYIAAPSHAYIVIHL